MDDNVASHLAAACSRSALHPEAFFPLRDAFPACRLIRLSFGLQNKVMLSITVGLEEEGRTHASYVPIHPTAAAAAVLQNNPVVVVRQEKRSPLWDQEDLYQREGCSALSVVSMPFYWPPRQGAQWEGAPLSVPQNSAFHPTFGALTAAGNEPLTQEAMHTLLDLASRTGRHVGPHISQLLSSLEGAGLLPSEADAQEELGLGEEEGEDWGAGEESMEDLFGFEDAHSKATAGADGGLLSSLAPSVPGTGRPPPAAAAAAAAAAASSTPARSASAWSAPSDRLRAAGTAATHHQHAQQQQQAHQAQQQQQQFPPQSQQQPRLQPRRWELDGREAEDLGHGPSTAAAGAAARQRRSMPVPGSGLMAATEMLGAVAQGPASAAGSTGSGSAGSAAATPSAPPTLAPAAATPATGASAVGGTPSPAIGQADQAQTRDQAGPSPAPGAPAAGPSAAAAAAAAAAADLSPDATPGTPRNEAAVADAATAGPSSSSRVQSSGSGSGSGSGSSGAQLSSLGIGIGGATSAAAVVTPAAAQASVSTPAAGAAAGAASSSHPGPAVTPAAVSPAAVATAAGAESPSNAAGPSRAAASDDGTPGSPAPSTSTLAAGNSYSPFLFPWHSLSFQPAGVERDFAIHYSRKQEKTDIAALGLLAMGLLAVAAAHLRAAWHAGLAVLLLFTPYFIDARLYQSFRDALLSAALILLSVFVASITQTTEPLSARGGSCSASSMGGSMSGRGDVAVGSAGDTGSVDSCSHHLMAGFGICWFIMHTCGLDYLLAAPLLLRMRTSRALPVQCASLALALHRLPGTYLRVLGRLDTVHVMLLALLLMVGAGVGLSMGQAVELKQREAWLARRRRRAAAAMAAGGAP